MNTTNTVSSTNLSFSTSDDVRMFRKTEKKKQSTAHITPEFLKMLAKVQGKHFVIKAK